ncbi:hypothetical protein STA3757_44540 [Stanieria sp. NIES-3757]|jgi:cytochrome b6-f complex subunit 6|nr:hypothetical protein STA3757_44540 [Stanieria sp. NIES-3757]
MGGVISFALIIGLYTGIALGLYFGFRAIKLI